MSPRDAFWFIAGALVAFAVGSTARAWLPSFNAKPSVNRPDASSATAHASAIPIAAIPLLAALSLIAVALGIYFLLGSPDSIAAERGGTVQDVTPSRSTRNSGNSNAGSLDDVTGKLADRLARDGGSDEDWRLLAQSYEYMGRSQDAQAALKHTVNSSSLAAGGSASAGALLSTADAMRLASSADAMRMADSAGSNDDARGASAGAPGSLVPVSTSNTLPAPGIARISGKISVAGKLAASLPRSATLFVYAKQPDVPGPPLAVMRLQVGRWPVSFVLDDSNSMVPGRNLSGAAQVQLEARISLSGEASPKAGDLVGKLTGLDPRDGHEVTLSIDHELAP